MINIKYITTRCRKVKAEVGMIYPTPAFFDARVLGVSPNKIHLSDKCVSCQTQYCVFSSVNITYKFMKTCV